MTQTTALSVSLDDVQAFAGETFGPSAWYQVTQRDIAGFGDVTGDHNPIHVDAAYAAASRYGGTIAHGLLTLSLMVPMLREIFSITDASLRINYGLNRVRFPAAVSAGARIRLRGEIKEVSDIPDGKQVVLALAHELEGSTKPACVADLVALYYSST